MFEFNPDGSLKLPGRLQAKKDKDLARLKSQRCVKFKRDIISFDAPKKCRLSLTVSEAFPDHRFVITTYNYFLEKASVETKITKVGDREYEIEIDTHLRRCTDCCSLINRFRDFLDGNIIDEKGNCPFEPRQYFY
ncbi:hypothetical protein K9M79_01770 [Candidatus Woesearchaeota archaeon]|nr:hypothetical protein [Candidatus Woesearchaeota archaeon]